MSITWDDAPAAPPAAPTSIQWDDEVPAAPLTAASVFGENPTGPRGPQFADLPTTLPDSRNRPAPARATAAPKLDVDLQTPPNAFNPSTVGQTATPQTQSDVADALTAGPVQPNALPRVSFRDRLPTGPDDPALDAKLIDEYRRNFLDNRISDQEIRAKLFMDTMTPDQKLLTARQYLAANVNRENAALSTSMEGGNLSTPEAQGILTRQAAQLKPTTAEAFGLSAGSGVLGGIPSMLGAKGVQQALNAQAEAAAREHPIAAGAGSIYGQTAQMAPLAIGLGEIPAALPAGMARTVAEVATTPVLATALAESSAQQRTGQWASPAEIAEMNLLFATMPIAGNLTGRFVNSFPVVAKTFANMERTSPVLANVGAGMAKSIAGMVETNTLLRASKGEETTPAALMQDVAMALAGHATMGGVTEDIRTGQRVAEMQRSSIGEPAQPLDLRAAMPGPATNIVWDTPPAEPPQAQPAPMPPKTPETPISGAEVKSGPTPVPPPSAVEPAKEEAAGQPSQETSQPVAQETPNVRQQIAKAEVLRDTEPAQVHPGVRSINPEGQETPRAEAQAEPPREVAPGERAPQAAAEVAPAQRGATKESFAQAADGDVYKVNIRDKGVMYAVRDAVNGTARGGGDVVFATPEEASKASREMMQRREERSAAEKERAEQEREKAESVARQKAAREDLRGFGEGKPDIQRKQFVNVLNAQVRANGEVTTRRKMVEDRIKKGWTVRTLPSGERRFVDPKGDTFLLAKDITKIGMDYAEHLSKPSPAPIVAPNKKVETPPAEAGKGKEAAPEITDPKLKKLMAGGRELVNDEWLDEMIQKHPDVATEIRTAFNGNMMGMVDARKRTYVAWIKDEAKPTDLTPSPNGKFASKSGELIPAPSKAEGKGETKRRTVPKEDPALTELRANLAKANEALANHKADLETAKQREYPNYIIEGHKKAVETETKRAQNLQREIAKLDLSTAPTEPPRNAARGPRETSNEEMQALKETDREMAEKHRQLEVLRSNAESNYQRAVNKGMAEKTTTARRQLRDELRQKIRNMEETMQGYRKRQAQIRYENIAEGNDPIKAMLADVKLGDHYTSAYGSNYEPVSEFGGKVDAYLRRKLANMGVPENERQKAIDVFLSNGLDEYSTKSGEDMLKWGAQVAGWDRVKAGLKKELEAIPFADDNAKNTASRQLDVLGQYASGEADVRKHIANVREEQAKAVEAAKQAEAEAKAREAAKLAQREAAEKSPKTWAPALNVTGEDAAAQVSKLLDRELTPSEMRAVIGRDLKGLALKPDEFGVDFLTMVKNSPDAFKTGDINAARRKLTETFGWRKVEADAGTARAVKNEKQLYDTMMSHGAKESTRYAINGIYHEEKTGNLVATDGHRLLVAYPEAVGVKPTLEAGKVWSWRGKSAEQIEGTFPPYQDVIPKSYEAGPRLSGDALRRYEGSVKATIEEAGETVNGMRGIMGEGAPALVNDKVAVNPAYLYDGVRALRELGADSIEFQTQDKGGNKPVLLTGRKGETMVGQSVIMPINIKEGGVSPLDFNPRNIGKKPPTVPGESGGKSEGPGTFSNTKAALDEARAAFKKKNITLGSGLGNISDLMEHAVNISVAIVKDLAIAGKHGFENFIDAINDHISDATLRRLMINRSRDLYNSARDHADIKGQGIDNAMTPADKLPKQADVLAMAKQSENQKAMREAERMALRRLPPKPATETQVLKAAEVPQAETTKGTILRTTGARSTEEPTVTASQALAEKLNTESALTGKSWLAADARTKIVEAAKQLPMDLRGEFLHAVATAKNEGDIGRAMDRMENNRSTYELRQAVQRGAEVLASSRLVNIPFEYSQKAIEIGQKLKGTLDQIRYAPDRPRAKGEPSLNAPARDAYRDAINDYADAIQKAIADGKQKLRDQIAKPGTVPPLPSKAEKASIPHRIGDVLHDIVTPTEQYSYLRRDYDTDVQATGHHVLEVNKEITGTYNRLLAAALPHDPKIAARVQADLVRLGWHNRVNDMRSRAYDRAIESGLDHEAAVAASERVATGIPDCGPEGAAKIKADPLVRKAALYWLDNIATAQDANLQRAGQDISGWASRAQGMADPLDGLMINLPPENNPNPEHFGSRRRSYSQVEAMLDPTTGNNEYQRNITKVILNNIGYPIRARANAEFAQAVEKGGFMFNPKDPAVRQAPDGRAYVTIKGKEHLAKAVLVDDANGEPQPKFVPMDLANLPNYSTPELGPKSKIMGRMVNAYVTARLFLGADVGYHTWRELGNVGAVLAREGTVANVVPWAGGRVTAAERAYRMAILPHGDMLQLMAERMGFDRGTGYYVTEHEPQSRLAQFEQWGHNILFHPRYGVDTALRRVVAESYMRMKLGADAYNAVTEAVDSGKMTKAEGADRLADMLGGKGQISMTNFVNQTLGVNNRMLRSEYLNRLSFLMPFIGQHVGPLPSEIRRFATGNIPFRAVVEHARRGDIARASAAVVGGLMSGALGAYMAANLLNYGITSLDKDQNGKRIGGHFMWDNAPGHRTTPMVWPGVYWTNPSPGDSRPARILGATTALNDKSLASGATDIPRTLVNEMIGMIPLLDPIMGVAGKSPYITRSGQIGRIEPEELNPFSIGSETVKASIQRLRGAENPEPMGQAVAKDIAMHAGERIAFQDKDAEAKAAMKEQKGDLVTRLRAHDPSARTELASLPLKDRQAILERASYVSDDAHRLLTSEPIDKAVETVRKMPPEQQNAPAKGLTSLRQALEQRITRAQMPGSEKFKLRQRLAQKD